MATYVSRCIHCGAKMYRTSTGDWRFINKDPECLCEAPTPEGEDIMNDYHNENYGPGQFPAEDPLLKMTFMETVQILEQNVRLFRQQPTISQLDKVDHWVNAVRRKITDAGFPTARP